jgi:hypothetical protein
MYESDREKLNDQPLLATRLEHLIDGLNEAKESALHAQGFTNLVGKGYDNYHVKKVGPKFIYLDAGGSGCFLIERATGTLFNIKGYGVPDYNKHAKKPLGNVSTVDPTWLHSKRFNYLRD